jgi:hypothetical protein
MSFYPADKRAHLEEPYPLLLVLSFPTHNTVVLPFFIPPATQTNDEREAEPQDTRAREPAAPARSQANALRGEAEGARAQRGRGPARPGVEARVWRWCMKAST